MMSDKKEGLVHYVSANKAGKTYEQAMRLAEMVQKFTSVKIEVEPWKDTNELKSLRKEITALRKIAEAADWYLKYGHKTPNSSKVLIAEALKEWRRNTSEGTTTF